MIIRFRDKFEPSFKRISTPGVLNKSPLYAADPAIQHFTSENFQYIVNNIADMFGYAPNAVSAQVEHNDVVSLWEAFGVPKNTDNAELIMRFTMNAHINIYERESVYGKHFMYENARRYGMPFIWGVAAHEIGHLINHFALDAMENRLSGGRPVLMRTQVISCYWDELCADYWAGIILAKAHPPMDRLPMKNFLADTEGGKTHPDGYLRALAFEMGYMWGLNNPAYMTDAILVDQVQQRNLLISFFQYYYGTVYAQIDPVLRGRLTLLPHYLMQLDNTVLYNL